MTKPKRNTYQVRIRTRFLTTWTVGAKSKKEAEETALSQAMRYYSRYAMDAKSVITSCKMVGREPS